MEKNIIDKMSDIDLGYTGTYKGKDCRDKKKVKGSITDRKGDRVKCALEKYIFPSKTVLEYMKRRSKLNKQEKLRQRLYRKILSEYCSKSNMACSKMDKEGDPKPIDPICFELNECNTSMPFYKIPSEAMDTFDFFMKLMDFGNFTEMAKAPFKKSREQKFKKLQAKRKEKEMKLIKNAFISKYGGKTDDSSGSEANSENNSSGSEASTENNNSGGEANTENNSSNNNQSAGSNSENNSNDDEDFEEDGNSLNNDSNNSGQEQADQAEEKEEKDPCAYVNNWNKALSKFKYIGILNRSKKMSGTSLYSTKGKTDRTQDEIESKIQKIKDCYKDLSINVPGMGELKGINIFETYEKLNEEKSKLKGRRSLKALKSMTVDKVRALDAQQSAQMKAEYKDIKKGLKKTFTRKKKGKKKKNKKTKKEENNNSNSGYSGNNETVENNNNEYLGNEDNNQNAGNLTKKNKKKITKLTKYNKYKINLAKKNK